jgi:alkanesulfonate monooxygenase SsuD/methylene tetrahydromethanopterin reductase-like flavin-dependent oxidoreductase (luciferase family)
LWTTPVGEKFSYAGTHYTLEDSPALPKPLQQPHPPLILGGAGAKRTPRLAAAYADEFNVPFHTVADTQAQFDRVREACTRRGRDPDSLAFSAAQVVCCGADEAQVAARARAIGREVDELRLNGAAGTPDQVVARLRGLESAGAGTIYLQVLDLEDLDHLQLLSEHVLPNLG